ncbi:MAG: 5-amino-6-(D-ribitylamino)uracil--L-tyrosine 4-hydroxyphenyl transferase CofH [Candidatus Heimdallarchaeaceae archaeon]
MKSLSLPIIDEILSLQKFEQDYSDDIIKVRDMLKKRGKMLQKQLVLADELRAQQVGEAVSFVINYNINFTNHCMGTCQFCSYRYRKNNKDSHPLRMSLDDIKSEVKKAVEHGATEVCIQGGLDPHLTYEHYMKILKAVRKVSSSIHIHAFSPSEVAYMSQLSGESVEDIFKELKMHGLDSFPGTAAEILVDRIRKIICPDKITTKQWLNIVAAGHQVGLPSSATMMYGHIESLEDEAKHIVLLRYIQEETTMFTEFVPLPFIHHNTELYNNLGARAGSTGIHDLSLLSTARLYLGDVIPNLQVSWPKLGLKFAQVSLTVGVNDLGGTLFHENISKSAGASYGEYVKQEEFINLIRDAHRVPVQRDTIYNRIQIF